MAKRDKACEIWLDKWDVELANVPHADCFDRPVAVGAEMRLGLIQFDFVGVEAPCVSCGACPPPGSDCAVAYTKCDLCWHAYCASKFASSHGAEVGPLHSDMRLCPACVVDDPRRHVFKQARVSS